MFCSYSQKLYLVAHKASYINSGCTGMIKKTTEAQQSAEEKGEEGNLNNSDTNGNDITA